MHPGTRLPAHIHNRREGGVKRYDQDRRRNQDLSPQSDLREGLGIIRLRLPYVRTRRDERPAKLSQSSRELKTVRTAKTNRRVGIHIRRKLQTSLHNNRQWPRPQRTRKSPSRRIVIPKIPILTRLFQTRRTIMETGTARHLL